MISEKSELNFSWYFGTSKSAISGTSAHLPCQVTVWAALRLISIEKMIIFWNYRERFEFMLERQLTLTFMREKTAEWREYV